MGSSVEVRGIVSRALSKKGGIGDSGICFFAWVHRVFRVSNHACSGLAVSRLLRKVLSEFR